MTLTAEQQKKVEQNIRLVQKVINDKVHGPYQLGIYTYDDIFQIGCIGLCKAVATDRGGTFSTYAYRLIWNEICDALVYATRRQTREIPSDLAPLVQDESEMDTEVLTQRIDVQNALERAKENASPCVVKGILWASLQNWFVLGYPRHGHTFGAVQISGRWPDNNTIRKGRAPRRNLEPCLFLYLRI